LVHYVSVNDGKGVRTISLYSSIFARLSKHRPQFVSSAEVRYAY